MFKTFLNGDIPKILARSFLLCHGSSRYLHRAPDYMSIFNSKQTHVDFTSILNQKISSRFLTISSRRCSEAELSEEGEKKSLVDPSKDRTKIIPPETSIRYLKSAAYKTTYGDDPVWVKYRRNFKGQFVPKRTRKSCVRKGVLSTGNPCPICRDEYLVLHYTNVDLLKQFIHPHTGEIIDSRKTHVCRKKLQQLEVAITKAKSYGLLIYEVPFREYDYKEYYPNLNEQ